MKVLVLICARDRHFEKAASRIVQLVRDALSHMVHHHERVDLEVRSHRQLRDMLPDRATPIHREHAAQFEAVKRFDMIDLVFAHASHDFLPWIEAAEDVRWFVRNCLHSRKCLFASGALLQMLVYVLETGGDVVARPIKSTDGAPLGEIGEPGSPGAPDGPVIDSVTGEILAWDARTRAWRVTLDCGSHVGSAHPRAPYRHVDQRHRDVEDMLLARDSSCRQWHARVHPQAYRHPLTTGLPPAVLVQSRNHWHCHARAERDFGPLGTLRVLLTHPFGAQCVEVGNAVAVQFELEAAYPVTTTLLARFVRDRHALLSQQLEGHIEADPKAPVQLAYVVGQVHITGIPSRQLDVIGALAPHGQARLREFRGPRPAQSPNEALLRASGALGRESALRTESRVDSFVADLVVNTTGASARQQAARARPASAQPGGRASSSARQRPASAQPGARAPQGTAADQTTNAGRTVSAQMRPRSAGTRDTFEQSRSEPREMQRPPAQPSFGATRSAWGATAGSSDGTGEHRALLQPRGSGLPFSTWDKHRGKATPEVYFEPYASAEEIYRREERERRERSIHKASFQTPYLVRRDSVHSKLSHLSPTVYRNLPAQV